MKRWIAAALAAAVAMPAVAQDAKAHRRWSVDAPKGAHDYGFAGMMAKDNRADLPPLTLASGKPVAEGAYHLKSGDLLPDRDQRRRLAGAGALGRRLLPGSLD